MDVENLKCAKIRLESYLQENGYSQGYIKTLTHEVDRLVSNSDFAKAISYEAYYQDHIVSKYKNPTTLAHKRGLLGRIRNLDLHPLDNAHAEHTKMPACLKASGLLGSGGKTRTPSIGQLRRIHAQGAHCGQSSHHGSRTATTAKDGDASGKSSADLAHFQSGIDGHNLPKAHMVVINGVILPRQQNRLHGNCWKCQGQATGKLRTPSIGQRRSPFAQGVHNCRDPRKAENATHSQN